MSENENPNPEPEAEPKDPAAPVEPALENQEPEPSSVEPVEPKEPTEPKEPAEPKEPKASAAKPAPAVDWRDKRIAQLTARLKEFQEKPAAEPKDPAAPLDPTAEFNRQVQEAAARQVEAQQFSARCNAVVKKGQDQYGKDEFDARLGQLRNLVDVTNPAAVTAYENFIRAGLETDNLDRIIFDLAGDPEEAIRVLSLSPMKMAVELTKMAGAPEPEPVSKAPKPIVPVNGGGARSHVAIDAADPASDRLSTAEWMKRREAALANGRGR